MSTGYNTFNNEDEAGNSCAAPPHPPQVTEQRYGYTPKAQQGYMVTPPMNQGHAPPQPNTQGNVMIAPVSRTIKTGTKRMPDDHFCYALFTCLCCFWPLGIVALVASDQVKYHFASGDMIRAKHASNDAKTYSTISLCVGIVLTGTTVFLITVFVAIR